MMRVTRVCAQTKLLAADVVNAHIECVDPEVQ